MNRATDDLVTNLERDLADCTSAVAARECGKRAVAALRGAFRDLGALPAAERRTTGQALNQARVRAEALVAARLEELLIAAMPATAALDLSAPIAPLRLGQPHPTVTVLRRINTFFQAMGFQVIDGPEIESDWYNFGALNLPPEHPSREMHDTIYLREPELLLRTHTSSMEIRALERQRPPLRVLVPGKAYRAEAVNATNSSMFYQYEVLAVERNLSMAHLRGTVAALLDYLFGDALRTRVRAKYYPQVEPGMGVDLECRFCRGAGCGVCKGKGWIEILGGGMVHPNALAAVGIDWHEHSGFAFGMGLDRLVMSTTGIADIRQLYGERMVYLPVV